MTFAEAETVVDDYLGHVCAESKLALACIAYQERVRNLEAALKPVVDCKIYKYGKDYAFVHDGESCFGAVCAAREILNGGEAK